MKLVHENPIFETNSEIESDNFTEKNNREFVLFFSGSCKFCPALGLRQLTRDVKSDVRIQISEVTSLLRYHEKLGTEWHS